MSQPMMNTQVVRLPALKIQQNNHHLFMVHMPSEILLDQAKVVVDKWQPGTEDMEPEKQGYQREEMQLHLNQVANYLAKEPNAILPTSALLSLRGPVTFEPADTDEHFGYLVVNRESLPFYIVDGQHRIAGFRHALEAFGRTELRQFTLPVIVMANVRKYDEVEQFFLVNSTSKRIKTDLAQRLLTEMAAQNDRMRTSVVGKGQGWILRAVRIADLLNKLPGSPWEGRIQRPNERKIGEIMIAESSFTQSMRPILDMALMQRLPDDKIAELIDRYWKAIRSFMPEAFLFPRQFAIQKTTGVYPWHMVAPTVFELCRSTGNFSEDYMHEILEHAQQFLTEDFWRSGEGDATAYSSRAGFKVLADMIQQQLPTTDVPLDV